MANIGDFRIGERVAHIRLGDGVVIGEGDDVRVKYDCGTVGIYDDTWFRYHPLYLFHRPSPSDAQGGK